MVVPYTYMRIARRNSGKRGHVGGPRTSEAKAVSGRSMKEVMVG